MKTCKNCGTSNRDDAIRCTSCSMKEMFVSHHDHKTNDNLKSISPACPNCGTIERGNSSRCVKCNFPISNKLNETKQDSNSKKVS